MPWASSAIGSEDYSAAFSTPLTNASVGLAAGDTNFNEYTFYRMLAQMGMESAPEPTNRSHGITSLESSLPDDLNLEIARVEEAMLAAAGELRFEEAAALRDYLHSLQRQGLEVTLDSLSDVS